MHSASLKLSALRLQVRRALSVQAARLAATEASQELDLLHEQQRGDEGPVEISSMIELVTRRQEAAEDDATRLQALAKSDKKFELAAAKARQTRAAWVTGGSRARAAMSFKKSSNR